MIVPLVIIAAIAAVNFQGFININRDVKRVRYLMVLTLVFSAGFLFNHSSVWRMHNVQNKFNAWIEENADAPRREATVGEYYKEHYKLALYIKNKSEDVYYIAVWWVGLFGTCMSMVLIAWWLWYDRRVST